MTDEEYLKKYLKKEDLEEGLQKLKQGIPVQYIVGNVDFYGFSFDVDERVLIPRFETEELVARTITYIQKYFDKDISILDVGTGSGCIAITLEKKLQVTVDAVDIEENALEVAKINQEKLHSNVHFFKSDLFNNVEKKYDVIISNPPYIAYDEDIMEVVKENEPHSALYAKNHGLYCYQEILKNAHKHVKKSHLLAFEIGSTQAEELIQYAREYFPNSQIWKEQDLAGFDRYLFIYTK